MKAVVCIFFMLLILTSFCNLSFAQSITVTSPNGAECWLTGTTRNITWTDTGLWYVSGWYSTDGGSTWIQISGFSWYSNNRTFSWTIPSGICSQTCRVKVADAANTNVYDISNSNFSIVTNVINPALFSPANGSTPTPPFNLVWNPVTCSLGGYQVQVSTNSSFTNNVIDQTTSSTSYSIGSSTLTPRTYYWRVKASNCYGYAWSNNGTGWTFTVPSPPILVTVTSSPSGRSLTVDGSPCIGPCGPYSWTAGSSHTITTTSPQSGTSGTQYLWSSWSDGGAISHTVAPTSNMTYTASFTTRYYLTMNAGTGGTVSPSSGYVNSGQNVPITATPGGGYVFSSWTGAGSGSYTGTNNPAQVTMNGPITQTANFSTASAPPVPSLISPLDNAYFEIPQTVNFSWVSSSGATSYRIQVAENTSYSPTVVDATPSNASYSWLLSPAYEMKRFYWRVRACAGSNCSAYSTDRNFFTLDRYEPNNSLGSPNTSAFPTSQNQAFDGTVNATVYPSDNVDFYKVIYPFPPSDWNRVEIWLTNLAANYDLHIIRVVDLNSGPPYNYHSTNSGTTPEHLGPINLYSGDGFGNYFLVYVNNPGGGSSATSPYTLRVKIDRTSVGVKEISSEIPRTFDLAVNHPNPFNPSTRIQYALPTSGHAVLRVFNMLGEDVGTLVDDQQHAGTYEVVWEAQGKPSGIYYYRMMFRSTDGTTHVDAKKAILLK